MTPRSKLFSTPTSEAVFRAFVAEYLGEILNVTFMELSRAIEQVCELSGDSVRLAVSRKGDCLEIQMSRSWKTATTYENIFFASEIVETGSSAVTFCIRIHDGVPRFSNKPDGETWHSFSSGIRLRETLCELLHINQTEGVVAG